jgi:ABC-type polar amino acid transport system ATPase subunit
MSTPLITVENVNKHFGPHHVLRDVTTHFNAGEVAVIVGASGSGKSTLLRTLNRLEKHDSGRITVDGIEVSDHPRRLDALRAEVGMVFQQFNLFPHLRRARARSSCSTAWGWRRMRTSIRSRSRAASSSAWRSRAAWRCSRA